MRKIPLPVRLIMVVLVLALDTALLPLLLVMSVAVLAADWMMSPSHWKERGAQAIKMPRPWEMPKTTVLLYQYHWRVWVHPKPARPDPNTLWP